MVAISNTALFASANNISTNTSNTAAAAARLASGRRLVAAADDIAALATGTSLNTQVNTLRAALGNVTQASSLLQVAGGGLAQQLDILDRQKALSLQASSGQLNDTARAALNQEFQSLSAELTRIAGSTNFNGVALLNGGTNTATTLSSTDALSAAFQPTVATGSNASSAANSSVAIQAFNSVTGAAASGGATAGNLDVVDSAGNVLSNGAFNTVDSSLSGGLSNFTLSNVNFGSSATITATVGGVEFSGTYTNGSTSAVLSNGTTNIRIATGTNNGAAAALNISDAGAVANAEAGLNNVFSNTQIQRVQVVGGVDFSGTALAGATGTAAAGGVATARLNSANASISNFQYVGNNGSANSNTLSVEINGQTFTATGVRDSLTSANGSIVFQSADNQIFKLDLTGLTTATGNIRTDSAAQNGVINALNSGFANAGGPLNFAAGSTGSDPIAVSLTSTTANSLFNGQSLSISSQSAASTTASAIDAAINRLSAAQASVGAQQSRLDSSSAALTSAISSQQAAASNLLDTDFARESSNFSALRVQQEASIAVQAQTKKLSQTLLRLVQ